MSYREVRGSFYSAARANETQSGLPSSETEYVSFRLVHDIAFAACIGTMHNLAPEVVSEPDRSLVSPLRWHRNLGFRLAREEE